MAQATESTARIEPYSAPTGFRLKVQIYDPQMAVASQQYGPRYEAELAHMRHMFFIPGGRSLCFVGAATMEAGLQTLLSSKGGPYEQDQLQLGAAVPAIRQ